MLDIIYHEDKGNKRMGGGQREIEKRYEANEKSFQSDGQRKNT